MSDSPTPDEQTLYSSHRQGDVDALAWPVFSEHALDLLRAAGQVLTPTPARCCGRRATPMT
jgi:thioredoxin reductase (NADPH)